MNNPHSDNDFTVYNQWKSNIPILYDFFENHNLDWPSYSCCFGNYDDNNETSNNNNTTTIYNNNSSNNNSSSNNKNNSNNNINNRSNTNTTSTTFETLFITRTTDAKPEISFPGQKPIFKGHPNMIIKCNLKLPRIRRTRATKMTQFNEEAQSQAINYEKCIIHPNGVHRIKSINSVFGYVLSLSDAPNVYVWNMNKQEARNFDENQVPSVPDFTLETHLSDKSLYALDTSISTSNDPYIACAGQDSRIFIWKIFSQTSKSHFKTQNIFLEMNTKHTKTIEDLAFHPKAETQLCSVGDDASVRFYDLRDQKMSTNEFEMKNCTKDINCVSWNKLNTFYIVFGSSDNSIQVLDRRFLNKSLISVYNTQKMDNKNVTNVKWSPFYENYFVSSSEDCCFCLWDLKNLCFEEKGKEKCDIMFKHVGHRTPIVDFDWLSTTSNHWTFISVSDDSSHLNFGGGTLQIWRPFDYFYRAKEDVIKEFSNLQCIQRFIF